MEYCGDGEGPKTRTMTVGDMIRRLQAFKEDLPCCYRNCSEWTAFEEGQIEVRALQEARADGWVGNQRPDRPTRDWVTFPGN